MTTCNLWIVHAVGRMPDLTHTISAVSLSVLCRAAVVQVILVSEAADYKIAQPVARYCERFECHFRCWQRHHSVAAAVGLRQRCQGAPASAAFAAAGGQRQRRSK